MTGRAVPLDYNEGWNAYRAASAMHGRALYPTPPSMMFNNYPPLSFYIVGTIGQLLGDQIFAGRLISLIAIVAISTSIGIWLRREGADRLESMFACLFFPGVLLAFTRYVGMNDPQLLGHALGTVGLLLIVRPNRSASAVVAAAALMTVAIFIKHILIVQPIAVLVWLARETRRNALLFSLSGVLLGLVGLTITNVYFHIDLLKELLSPRAYRIGLALTGIEKMFAAGLVPIVAAGMLYRAKPDDPGANFVAIYLTIAMVSAALFSGGAGVDSNAMFDAIIAGSLAIGLGLRELRARPLLSAWFALGCLLPLALAAVVWARSSWFTSSHWLSPKQSEEAATQFDVVFLAKAGDPVFCETLALCYWAGRQPAVDVFSFSQAVVAGRREEKQLVELIEARRFQAVQVLSLATLPFSADLKNALERRYRVDHVDSNGVFLLPR
jgi:hypothetical protein